MIDQYNRKVDYLRLSVTDNCNLRCVYCMHDSEIKFLDNDKKLRDDEIIKLVSCCAKAGISKVRITGGEPLVRSGIIEVISKINKIPGIKEIYLTTNGILLEDMVEKLVSSGLKGVNISLDSLKEDKFRLLTKVGNLNKVLKSINKSLELGLEVKLNIVLIEELNFNEVNDFVNLTKNNKIDIRFIELMPIGIGKLYKGISNERVLEKIKLEYENIQEIKGKLVEGPAKYIKILGYKGRIGFISAVSNCFCSECNRIRITADGFVKRCLYEKSSLNLRDLLRNNIDTKALEDIIYSTIYSKPESKEDSINRKEENRFMNEIGG